MNSDSSVPTAEAAPRGDSSTASARARLGRWLRRLRAPRLRSSIGPRLAILALALGLPFVVYVGGNAARQTALERDEVKLRTLSLARLFAARLDDYVGDMQSALALVGHGAALDEAGSASNDALLQRIRADLPRSLANVAVWTLDGRNIGALDHTGITRDLSIADRRYFKAALETKTTVIEGPLDSRIAREPVLVFARPVLGADGRVLGVVTAASRVRDLQWLLDLKGAAPAGTVVSIVNQDGVVVARSIDAARWIGKSVMSVGNAAKHIEAREGVDETRGFDNVSRIAGYTQAERVPWHVFVGIPADDALEATRANLRATLLFGTLSLLIGAALAAYLGVRIARPLRQLAYDAMLFARGNLSHRTRVGGDDETGVLANTLNRMAQLIEDRTRALEEKSAALERSRLELATITANVPVLIAHIDANEQFRFANEYFRDVFGFEPEKIIGRSLRDVFGADVYGRFGSRIRDVMSGLPQAFETSFTTGPRAPVFIVTCFPDYGDDHVVHGAYVVCQDITRRKEAEEALQARERFVRLIADAIPARVTYSDTRERLLFGNKRFAEYWGTDPRSIVGRRVDDVVSKEAYAQIGPELARSYRGETRRFDLIVERDGGTQYYQVDHVPDIDAQGKVHGIVSISQDVTALHEAQANAEASERRLRRITDNIASMVAYIDRDRRYRFNSRYYENWLGRPLSEITGRLVSEVLGSVYEHVRPNLDRAFAGERVDFDVEVEGADGSRFVHGTYIPDFDAQGRVVGVYSSSTDVTAQKEIERQLERLAQNDSLTGLPNRHMFNDGIAAALRRSQRAGTHVALLFLDIDAFKQINDSLGHAAGDDVLREFARRLKASVRATDLVARLAGDEFVVVLEGIHSRDECRFIARKILAAMRNKFAVADNTLRVTTSIGIALGHGSSTTPEALLKRADSALYAAKGQGRDRFEIAI